MGQKPVILRNHVAILPEKRVAKVGGMQEGVEEGHFCYGLHSRGMLCWKKRRGGVVYKIVFLSLAWHIYP